MKETWKETQRLNELREANRKVALTIRLPLDVYRRLVKQAMEARTESSTFIEKLLEEVI